GIRDRTVTGVQTCALPISMRKKSNLAGPQSFQALVHVPSGKGLFTPADNAVRNIWFSLDIPAMANASGLTLLPVVADAFAVEWQIGRASCREGGRGWGGAA